jgi:hypothetical protein
MPEQDASRAPALVPAPLDISGSAAPSIGEDSGDRYTPRSAEHTLLHRVVCEQLEPFLARARARERPAPHFVEQELRSFLRSLFTELRRRVRQHWGVCAEQCGAVTFLQRFGSALNLNLHFHTLALDGAYPYPEGYGKTPRFWALPPPTPDDVARVLAGTARRIGRMLGSRAEEDDDALARDEPLLAVLAAASLRARIADGAQRGEPWRRVGDRVDPEDRSDDPDATPRVPQLRGMSLHADVSVPARDRRRLERLCRYVARPPLATERLEERPDGRLLLRLKTRWRDGTTHIAIERSALIDRLVPLIPPPRAHQVRYHGILAPCASLRSRVVPVQEFELEPAAASAAAPEHEAAPATDPAGQPRADSRFPRADQPDPRPRRLRWAALLQRVFGLDALSSLRGHPAPDRRGRGRCDCAAHPRMHRASRASAADRPRRVERYFTSVIGDRSDLGLRPDAVHRRSVIGATESEPPRRSPISA